LENLKSACGVLTINHKFEKCNPYKLFTFISNRDKGLIPVLKEAFPDNHYSTSCLFHNKQNIIKKFGMDIGDMIEDLGHTFLQCQEDKLIFKIQKIYIKAEDCVINIDPRRGILLNGDVHQIFLLDAVLELQITPNQQIPCSKMYEVIIAFVDYSNSN
jgi:hypothetical protein